MPYYLSEYLGAGTHDDPFRPVGSDQPGWSAIDLRPDASVITGRCLLHLPVADANPLLRKLSDDKAETIGTSNRNFLRTALAKSTLVNDRLDITIAELLLRPPVGAWNRLQALRDRYEINLGGLLWESAVPLGASDNFNRANETPIAAPWTEQIAAGTNINLASNAATKATSGDSFWYYAAAASGNDQYSQWLYVTTITGGDFGPSARITSSTALSEGYWCAIGGGRFSKFVAGSFSIISDPGATSTATGITYGIEVEGSTLRWMENGTQIGSNGTDTSLTGAGSQPGVFWYESGGSLDNWEGGDLEPPPPPTAAVAWFTA